MEISYTKVDGQRDGCCVYMRSLIMEMEQNLHNTPHTQTQAVSNEEFIFSFYIYFYFASSYFINYHIMNISNKYTLWVIGYASLLRSVDIKYLYM